jgi:TRAP-type C4-dicarboxylate transport system permease small subunit
MHPQNSKKRPENSEKKSKGRRGIFGIFEATEMTSCTIGAIALTIMASVLGCGIVSRYVFGKPIPGVYDIVQLLLVWVVFLSLSYTEKEKRHIRVEIILRRLSHRRRIYFDVASAILGGVFCALMSWQSAQMAWSSILNREYWPGLLRVPIYPSKIALFVGITILAIRFFLDAKASMREIRQL